MGSPCSEDADPCPSTTTGCPLAGSPTSEPPARNPSSARSPSQTASSSRTPAQLASLCSVNRPLGYYFAAFVNRMRLQRLGVEVFVLVADYQVISNCGSVGGLADYVRGLVTTLPPGAAQTPRPSSLTA